MRIALALALRVELLVTLVASAVYVNVALTTGFWTSGGDTFTHPRWMPRALGSVLGSVAGDHWLVYPFTATLVAVWALYLLAKRSFRREYPREADR